MSEQIVYVLKCNYLAPLNFNNLYEQIQVIHEHLSKGYSGNGQRHSKRLNLNKKKRGCKKINVITAGTGHINLP